MLENIGVGQEVIVNRSDGGTSRAEFVGVLRTERGDHEAIVRYFSGDSRLYAVHESRISALSNEEPVDLGKLECELALFKEYAAYTGFTSRCKNCTAPLFPGHICWNCKLNPSEDAEGEDEC